MKAYVKIIFISVIAALLSTGCNNTVQGFGKDMENSGQQIQQAVSGEKK